MSRSTLKCVIDGVSVEISEELIRKYDRPLPRYTSYPPAPAWRGFSPAEYEKGLASLGVAPLCIYLHVPFCDAKCSFCGCNSIVTHDEGIKERYVAALISESETISRKIPGGTQVDQIHFGGGTPTSVGIGGVSLIMNSVRKRLAVLPGAEISIELDPRSISTGDIGALARMGFNRMSFGIQDFDPEVSANVGRTIDPRRVEELVREARSKGVGGINIDLIYGLPGQRRETWKTTLEKIAAIAPDRVALFNFAYLPRALPHQKRIDPKLLPSPFEKVGLFAAAVEAFERAGYAFIGLDHFALPGDTLSRAHRGGTLTRNFQGYTPASGTPIVGLGTTAIGELDDCYAQNEKRLSDYLKKVESGILATSKGIALTRKDHMRRFAIRRLLCAQRLDRNLFQKTWGVDIYSEFPDVREKIAPLVKDGIARVDESGIAITPLGRFFPRFVAAAFDATMDAEHHDYSKGV